MLGLSSIKSSLTCQVARYTETLIAVFCSFLLSISTFLAREAPVAFCNSRFNLCRYQQWRERIDNSCSERLKPERYLEVKRSPQHKSSEPLDALRAYRSRVQSIIMMRCFEAGTLHVSDLSPIDEASVLPGSLPDIAPSFLPFECLKTTMLTSQLFLFLSLPFLASVYADYVVYPRIRNNIRLNAAITDSITFFLGAENVQTFISRPRQVYEFWLIKATDTQAVVVGGITGVSILCQYWLGLTGLLMLDIRS